MFACLYDNICGMDDLENNDNLTVHDCMDGHYFDILLVLALRVSDHQLRSLRLVSDHQERLQRLLHSVSCAVVFALF